MSTANRSRWIILRDLLIFQVKLFLDGAKDLVLSPVSLGAAVIDLFIPTDKPGERFYAVMRLGEKFDRWLSLFGAAEKASALDDGLFGASRAGEATFLGRLELLALGHEEPASAGAANRDP
jgi:hypothetical protein